MWFCQGSPAYCDDQVLYTAIKNDRDKIRYNCFQWKVLLLSIITFN